MKRSLGVAVLTVSMLGLAACASSGSTTSYNEPAKKYQPTRMDSDEAYMARVESYARRRGIDLTWVHPPKKIVAKQE